ncbi:metal-dependent hydrolase [Halosolutus amylolyticus]|uniref:Metal-dependent hydrolase n=1 Tax=Halosolutus amylolyticus TaxID=2932267 RepID=A0ABD5PTN4_9EURY|nr:metal-dependent hydrolase [Halosolutus amylolyticus]
MWPWGHLAVAYLLYTASTRFRFDRPPRAWPLLALAVGTQFPDLVDKPLAWSVGILPGGRTFTHSLLVAALFVPAITAVAIHLDRREVGVAFALGYVTHLFTDVPPSVFAGDLAGVAYLAWPLVDQPPEDPVGGLLDAILHYYAMGPYEVFQLGLFVVAALVWYRDGRPGLERLWSSIERLETRVRS